MIASSKNALINFIQPPSSDKFPKIFINVIGIVWRIFFAKGFMYWFIVVSVKAEMNATGTRYMTGISIRPVGYHLIKSVMSA
jgi:hypothetical protein